MWIEIVGIPFFLSIIAISGIIPWVIRFAKHFHLVDDPKKRRHPAHTHTGIIPRAGGLAIFLVISIISFFYLPLNKLFIGLLLVSSSLPAQEFPISRIPQMEPFSVLIHGEFLLTFLGHILFLFGLQSPLFFGLCGRQLLSVGQRE